MPLSSYIIDQWNQQHATRIALLESDHHAVRRAELAIEDIGGDLYSAVHSPTGHINLNVLVHGCALAESVRPALDALMLGYGYEPAQVTPHGTLYYQPQAGQLVIHLMPETGHLGGIHAQTH